MKTKRIILFCLLAILSTTVGAAHRWTLTYQGFPYKRTSCALPTYKVGETINLTTWQPIDEEGHKVVAWRYDGDTYNPGEEFTMPDEDVELVPVWDYEGIEGVQNTEYRIQKILRDGRLIIVRDGEEYDVLGLVIGDW